MELTDTHPAITVFNHFAFDADGFDFFANDGDWECAVLVFTEDGENDFGFGLTAHAFNCIVERHALDHSIINFGDQVAGLETSAVCRRAFNGGDDFDQAFFLRNLNAYTDKFARGAFAEFFVGFFIEIL